MDSANDPTKQEKTERKKIGSYPLLCTVYVLVWVCTILLYVYVLYIRYKKYSYLTAPLALAVQNSAAYFLRYTMVVGFSSSEELTAGTFNEAKLNIDSIDHITVIYTHTLTSENREWRPADLFWENLNEHSNVTNQNNFKYNIP